MAEESLATMIAQSNDALAETLATALHRLRPTPNVRLGKFMGHHRKAGDRACILAGTRPE